MAALALALRFVPYSDDRGNFDLLWSAVMGFFGLLAVAASVYLVYVLEILKLRRFSRIDPETGEFEALQE
jgi:UDP-GlcNAc:undecaprenyl-phosphate GlcNAc-1-phosphate transferase